MINEALGARVQELVADRLPFVLATVVRTARPTSVRPGDSALVLSDGTIEGFVGGTCAQASVRLHAARALETGDPVLLRLEPGGEAQEDARDGVVVVHNPCLSGGSLEIFLQPRLPAARIVVAGETPVARALAAVARAAGYDVVVDAEPVATDAALVVATHGTEEEAALTHALEIGVGYVALVASRKRGAAVLDALDVPDALRTHVHTPAGLDIGARTPGDIAISILAELVAERTARPPGSARPVSAATAVDPVCGMEVVIGEATVHLDAGGERLYFCCAGCRATYTADVA
jgi:xanthine dehydrogenase accessory factor